MTFLAAESLYIADVLKLPAQVSQFLITPRFRQTMRNQTLDKFLFAGLFPSSRIRAFGSKMVKGRYGSLQSKKWSTLRFAWSMLFMFSVVLLMLLALGIVWLPINTEDSPPDLSSARRRSLEKYAFCSLSSVQKSLIS